MPTLEALPEATALPKDLIFDTQPAKTNAKELPSDAMADIQGYSYTRADGTVERAATPEEAMKLCPVLGKMSVEQANVMLELSAIGKEKMAERATKQAEPKEPTRAASTKVDKASTPDEPLRITTITETINRAVSKEVPPTIPADVAARLQERLRPATIRDTEKAVVASKPTEVNEILATRSAAADGLRPKKEEPAPKAVIEAESDQLLFPQDHIVETHPQEALHVSATPDKPTDIVAAPEDSSDQAIPIKEDSVYDTGIEYADSETVLFVTESGFQEAPTETSESVIEDGEDAAEASAVVEWTIELDAEPPEQLYVDIAEANEIVLGTFTVGIETEDIEEPLDIVDLYLSDDAESETDRTTILETFEKEYSQYVAPRSTAQAEAIKSIIEELDMVMANFPVATESISEEAVSLAQAELQDRTSEQLSIDKLNYLGTYEYKWLGNPSLLGNLTQAIKQKLQSYFALGKYALRITVS